MDYLDNIFTPDQHYYNNVDLIQIQISTFTNWYGNEYMGK